MRDKGVKRVKEKLMMKIAWLLPRDLAKWCAIRVISNATTGKYSSQEVTELSAMGAPETMKMNRQVGG